MRFLALALLFILGASAPALSKAPAPDWLTVIASTPEGGVRMGNPAAKVKLVEYGSRSCPVCGRFAHESAGHLRETYVASGKVSYEFREFLIHPQDIGASVIGKCVSDRNFFVVLDAMYANQAVFNERADTLRISRVDQIMAMKPLDAARAWSDDLGYTDLVRQAGMPEARIKACFSNPQAIPQLGARLQAGVKMGVDGTPNFFINGRKANAVLWSQLEPLLRAAGG
ncbi:DsbA family protein [Sphingomonas sp. LB-2]|uniref:DsbA family protein n=1 Tax=Sphingomonas caeni TaxID=2984949 RepID=UPI002230F092|nr:DsbA family protein [Sphingomonas caeni]MCW3847043.1 DsbA family protein [Sphingomonas caeni]